MLRFGTKINEIESVSNALLRARVRMYYVKMRFNVLSLLKFGFKVVTTLIKSKKFCSAVIVAAGSSQRMSGEDKLLIEINGIPVLGHTLMAFQDSGCISEIIIVTREEAIASVAKICKKYNINKVSGIIVGGLTRTESVFNGVSAVSKKASLIAIHDAARPCVDNTVIQRVVNMASKYKAAAPSIPITSTVKKVKNDQIIETVDREELAEIQGTISYEVVCAVGKRVPRVYLKNGEILKTINMLSY